MKRNMAILMIISIVAIHLFPVINHKVYADVQTIYYLHDVIDFTRLQAGDYNTDLSNYNLNYNSVDGYLKNDINYDNGSWTGSNFISNYSFLNNDYVAKWVNSVNNDYTVSNQNTVNYKGIEYPDIVVNGQILDKSKCKTIIATDGGANMPSGNYFVICSIYIPDDTICFLEQGRLMTSKNDVYYAYNIYNIYADGDYLAFSKYGNTSAGTNSYYTTYDFNQDSTPDLYQLYVTLNGWFYSDIPVYYTWSDHSDGAGAYLNQSPYYYGDYTGRGGSSNSVGKYVLSGADDTGFVVDRRTSSMINDGGSSVNPSQYGFKKGSFGNILYGGSFGSQKLMVGYEMNDASKSIQDKLALKLNYRYLFDGTICSQDIQYDESFYESSGYYDTYALQNTNYINVDLSKAFYYMYEDDGDYAQNLANVLDIKQGLLNGGYGHKVLDKTPLYLMDTLKNEGILVQYMQNVDDSSYLFESVSVTYKDVTVSPKFNFNTIFTGEYSRQYTNTINAIQLIVTESIVNLDTGEESSPYTFVYNYIDGSMQSIGNLEKDDELFDNKYSNGNQSNSSYTTDDIGYDLTTGTYYPSNAYGGSSNASVGDIIVYAGSNTVSKVFIDMPMEEALEHTPNLTKLYGDMKNGFLVSTDNSQSIIELTKDTYTFIPAEIWGYITICVVTCCGLAVYRNFRGR